MDYKELNELNKKFEIIVDEICSMYKLPAHDLPVIVSTKYKRFNGVYCFGRFVGCVIYINENMVNMNSYHDCIQTVIHEVFHHINRQVFKGSGHRGDFKRLMSLFQFKERDIKLPYKYQIKCVQCGNSRYRFNLTRRMLKISQTHTCSCGGQLELIDL